MTYLAAPSFLTKLFYFVTIATRKYNIDESHGLSHSMNVLNYANQIYEVEKVVTPVLYSQEKIIYLSAVLHDMCDKKYMDETQGLAEIEQYIQEDVSPRELEVAKQIMSTMSYSTVKKNGFPQLGKYQKAYNVVREADLLSAYDFDRSIIYHMQKNNCDLKEAFENANELFNNRVLQHNKDQLFTTIYGKKISHILHAKALYRIKSWKQIMKKPI
jgi:HD superfamily phosphodiesterase